MPKFIEKVLRSGEGKKLKNLETRVESVSALEEQMRALSDPDLLSKKADFRQRLANGEAVDDLLPEAFAVVREASRRSLGMRHFDVQIMGGIILHEGKIAEMKTGEGKTLVATLPVYLNALTGNAVHVVTVNDYLAARDAEWMSPVYNLLGLRAGVLQDSMRPPERREAYAADVIYGTNSEFGFDYLRDNMAIRTEDMVQRGHGYAIVDEVDSILIDEARTPLIISGAPEEAASTYYQFASIVPMLRPEQDYEVDEKHRTVAVTEEGVAKVEKALGIENLYESRNGQLVNHLMQALRAHSLFKRDVQYMVKDGSVLIVDEFTGRIMEGRRYSEGLHQAIEAKEKVRIREENQTLATITLQNYFRMYEKLAGMTGTAATEADEFRHIYKLEVVSIPPNRPMVRDDRNDLIYQTKKFKYKAVVEDVADCHERGQPVLVGTVSVEVSEHLSEMLRRRGIDHSVLNAKHHDKEADIIKDAGQKGAVTIATNMAGRGVDIKLGEGVVDQGGLYVLGTERHESRRIDNQLRGRAGRQGDPGASRFYLSAEDDVIRLFAGDRIYNIMEKLGADEDTPMEHKMLTRTVENAQRKVEQQNFQIRKRVLEYDDVMNKQREVIYDQRRKILEGGDISEDVQEIIAAVLADTVETYCERDAYPEDWDWDTMLTTLKSFYEISFSRDDVDIENISQDDLVELVLDDARNQYRRKEEDFSSEHMRELERVVMMGVIDNRWREHLYEMDYLREGIHWRSLSQKDPLVEYKSEGFKIFQELLGSIKEDFVRTIFHMSRVPHDELQARRERELEYSYDDGTASRLPAAAGAGGAAAGASAAAAASGGQAGREGGGAPVVTQMKSNKIGRNEPCPCGSGKKYKKCCGV
ncbi:MAG: preprotein translocase subunit SecA [Thermoleophilia bacterium]|nr:preprotein translocase subunit SecA [Thermoleophilia bacterium]